MNEAILNVRKAAVAGTFYPANPVELTKAVASMYAEVDKVPLVGRPMALIAPHAGYIYSGKTAAKAFKLLEGEEFDSVVIVSPSHSVFFKGSSVYEGNGYETPLGLVETDHDLARKIASVNPTVYFSNMGHAAGSSRGEHSLEVQLPFLQVALGKFKLVAIIMGEQDESSIRGLGEILAATIKGTNTLLVASTDLSHYHPEKEARTLDFAVQTAIEKYDDKQLMQTLESGEGEACGGGPVASVMMATKRLGGSSVQFLEYTTSGAVTGEFDEVVGYLSAAIVAGEKVKTINPALGALAAKPNEKGPLSSDSKKKLLQMARDSIEAKLAGNKFKTSQSDELKATRGMFVTLSIDGKLRGCIGKIRGVSPLYEMVAVMAPAAAFEDSRFEALSLEEFKRIEIEISLLSPLKRVHKISKIKVGRDGLLVKLDTSSGLLLPQVAEENGWDTDRFLEETSLKAGLASKGYKNERAEIYSFTVERF